MVTNGSFPLPEEWSDWSPWETVKGLYTVDDSKNYIFPKYKVVEEGSSDVSFCCIAKKNETVKKLLFGNTPYNTSTRQRKVDFTVKNVPYSDIPHKYYVLCLFSNGNKGTNGNDGTNLYTATRPDKPRDFTCETEDMITLKCTWLPLQENDKFPNNCQTHFVLSSVSDTITYCEPDSKTSICQISIREQSMYNVRLTAKNCLGENHTDLAFDVSHRVHPAAPYQLSKGDRNATAIELYWHIKPKSHKLSLLCQIDVKYTGSDGEEKWAKNYSIVIHSDPYPHIIVGGLQANTKYSFKVRCRANKHFWKWSDWSESINIRTDESAPSGQLDIWRDISPGEDVRNVTVFWKASSDFHANGDIKAYYIFWEKLDKPTKFGHKDLIPALKSTTISLDNEAYKISVSANNSVASSHPSVIIISATTDDGDMQKFDVNKEDTTNNTEKEIYISWRPQNDFDGYIVDWYNYPTPAPYNFQWKRFGRNDSSALITSHAFHPGERYTFRVYGLHSKRAVLLEKKVKYLKELEPTRNPNLTIAAVTSNSFTVTWTFYPFDESHPGFIRGYNIYVKPDHGNCMLKESAEVRFQGDLVLCKYTVEDPKEKRFTIKHLEPSTTYQVTINAYSVNPENITDNFQKITTKADRSGRLLFLLPPVIISLTLISCICFWKSDCVRKRYYPKVPHPSITAFLKECPGTIEIIHTTPDKLWLMGKHHIYTYTQSALGTPTYVDPIAFVQNLRVQVPERQTLDHNLETYRPLRDFDFTAYKPIYQTPAGACDNINYFSQMEVLLSGDPGSD
ncbi:oncostatin-M-specific receptor subunit beta-like isoform X2 [Hemicordylus capensis]|nr:oncostatin-M-specific receptor subunit beta-like isoform X2 [Hemicordylus capensis]XP_053143798.1 oncostatin-M-specific receptor subunit beta-like isoform X2 [Hemicordylus capensis]XP_053143799.1 oncostatin-M-specific receptor subunit beta-like isoform X2 [Hemicordylus capensis]